MLSVTVATRFLKCKLVLLIGRKGKIEKFYQLKVIKIVNQVSVLSNSGQHKPSADHPHQFKE